MKRKRRSVAASRAASLKGWRTRKQYQKPETWSRDVQKIIDLLSIDQPKTIDRIPKVEWKP